MGLTPKGRDWGDKVNWDDLGKFYVGFIISWTVILYSGVAWLVWKRNLPFIKIRNLPLAVTAVSFLHVYLVKIVLAYTTNGHFTCSAEFWIMSIYLPFGIAFFQANLAQLRSISEQQKKLINHSRIPASDSQLGRVAHLRKQWLSLSHLHKTYVLIGIGMAIQLLITGILYGTTPTLRGDWSSYGMMITHAHGQAKCRKSPQWTPSAFWQLFYSWVYGPYILYKIRHIHDTHHWRLQVILSVFSGLLGTPLWLASVFSPAFETVNRRWVPPMWLAPGIIVMQFVTIFFPVYETVTSRHQMRRTLSIIKDWEDSRKLFDSSPSDSHASEKPSFSPSWNVSSPRQAQLHTMASLEKALAINPTPLLCFAATKDFTAENITFLLQVRQWREAFANAPRVEDDGVSNRELANLFASATDIYMANVSERTADFPINIESRIRTDLDNIFSRAVPERSALTRILPYQQQTQQSPASPVFDTSGKVSKFAIASHRSSTQQQQHPGMSNREDSSDSGITLKGGSGADSRKPGQLNVNLPQRPQAAFPHHPGVDPLGKARAKIPRQFNSRVFDAAETSIKYLVLTNTWQKFVRASTEMKRQSTDGGSFVEQGSATPP